MIVGSLILSVQSDFKILCFVRISLYYIVHCLHHYRNKVIAIGGFILNHQHASLIRIENPSYVRKIRKIRLLDPGMTPTAR